MNWNYRKNGKGYRKTDIKMGNMSELFIAVYLMQVKYLNEQIYDKWN